MQFSATEITDDENALRQEVRSFIDQEIPRGSRRPSLGMNAEHSPEFTRKLAKQGWIGMAVPAEYGGPGRSAIDRFIVVEELLAAGAPIAAHWQADRQTVPSLLAHGTKAQCERFLPEIMAGRCFFSIGMSEPDAGSDLASVRTSATKVTGGWSVTGTKIWTSDAHKNHYFCVLCRTEPVSGDRHRGISQLIVDLAAPGVQVNAIPFLDGTHHFNEVVLTDVFVPDDMVLGNIGEGWTQVTSELSFERAGPDRYLTTWPLLEALVREQPKITEDRGFARTIGRLAARYMVIRKLCLATARAVDEGRPTAVEAAIVKDLGTALEQEVVRKLVQITCDDLDPTSASIFESILAQSVVVSPSYTIRGGATEVLRTIEAKALKRLL